MTNRRLTSGFTLLELLVVLGIMGLLGAALSNAPRAMVRAMEKRGTMQNVKAFIRAAYQRAQIDRMPTAVYLWNETVRAETEDEERVVVGMAVAVRQSGRISRLDAGMLVDEFADLQHSFSTNAQGQAGSSVGMRLYSMEKLYNRDSRPYTLVKSTVDLCTRTPNYLGGLESVEGDGKVVGYGFVPVGNSSGWKTGSAYGFEFQRLQLPHGYIFGSSIPGDSGITVVDTLVFRVDGAGGANVKVSEVRQKNGSLTAESIGQSDDPRGNLN